jgi:hypothetical protein
VIHHDQRQRWICGHCKVLAVYRVTRQQHPGSYNSKVEMGREIMLARIERFQQDFHQEIQRLNAKAHP